MADKPLFLDPTTGAHVQREVATSSTGAAQAGRAVGLDGSGLLDPSMLPVGLGSAMDTVQASEALSAGDFVNLYVTGGNARARKADASSYKPADGFVLAAVTSGQNAQVYRSGRNTAVTGLTPGDQFLSTTPGTVTTTPPSGTGQIVQRVGFAPSGTAVGFSRGAPTQLA